MVGKLSALIQLENNDITQLRGDWRNIMLARRRYSSGCRCSSLQLMPLPLTVSCFSKIQIGFTFLVTADPGIPGKRAVKRVCVCVWVYLQVAVCRGRRSRMRWTWCGVWLTSVAARCRSAKSSNSLRAHSSTTS